MHALSLYNVAYCSSLDAYMRCSISPALEALAQLFEIA